MHNVSGTANALVAMLIGAAISSLVLFIVIVMAQDRLEDSFVLDSYSGIAGLIIMVSGIQGVFIIAAAVLTMIWMFRSTKNVLALGRSTGSWSPGWAIGGWFCPPCIYVIPWLHLKALWKATEPNSSNGMLQAGTASPLITLWWVLYGIAPLFAGGVNIGIQGVGGFDNRRIADAYRGAVVSQGFSTALSLAAAAAMVTIVRQITARQKALVTT